MARSNGLKIFLCWLISMGCLACWAPKAFSSELEEAQALVNKALQDINNNIHLSDAKIKKLTEEVTALHQDQASLNRAIKQSAEQSRRIAAALALDEKKLRSSILQQQRSQKNLKELSKNFGAVISALASLGLDPPPALIVQSEDMRRMVRGADLLSFMLPRLQEKASLVQTELKKLNAIVKSVSEQKKALLDDLEQRAGAQKKMQLLLIERERSEKVASTSLQQNLQKKALLAQKMHNLQAFLANIQAPHRREIKAEQLQAAEEKLSNSIAFEKLKGKLDLPIGGVFLQSAKQETQLKVNLPGDVVTPADAVVLYAGRFRSYGNMVILDVGSNYYLIISGLKRLDVKMGMFVRKKMPLGYAEANDNLSIELRHGTQIINAESWLAKQ